MNTDHLGEILNDLLQTAIDTIHAHTHAIEHIHLPEVAIDLQQFEVDHQRQIDQLSVAVQRLGIVPVDPTPDLRGYASEAFVALRSLTGTAGALKALRSSEQTLYEGYERTLSDELPPDIHAIVRRGRDDERRHLLYLENALGNRIWDTGVNPRAGA